ncbi:hypothetical protein, partial [Eubacterium aggregans]|uniref:hypothetical protein n=1 Tax=Eubacterium aggregans TaxID=81409 RepID=UPI003F3BC2C7
SSTSSLEITLEKAAEKAMPMSIKLRRGEGIRYVFHRIPITDVRMMPKINVMMTLPFDVVFLSTKPVGIPIAVPIIKGKKNHDWYKI